MHVNPLYDEKAIERKIKRDRDGIRWTCYNIGCLFHANRMEPDYCHSFLVAYNASNYYLFAFPDLKKQESFMGVIDWNDHLLCYHGVYDL